MHRNSNVGLLWPGSLTPDPRSAIAATKEKVTPSVGINVMVAGGRWMAAMGLLLAAALSGLAGEFKAVTEYRYPTRYEYRLVTRNVNGVLKTSVLVIPKDFKTVEAGASIRAGPNGTSVEMRSTPTAIIPPPGQLYYYGPSTMTVNRGGSRFVFSSP